MVEQNLSIFAWNCQILIIMAAYAHPHYKIILNKPSELPMQVQTICLVHMNLGRFAIQVQEILAKRRL